MNGDDLFEQSTLGQFDAQTALTDAGTGADVTLTLTLLMTLAAAIIFVIVMGFVWFAWRRQTAGRS